MRWSPAATGLEGRAKHVTALVDVSEGVSCSILLAGTWDGIYRSTNGGCTWNPDSVSTKGMWIRAFATIRDSAGHVTILAGTDGHGVFLSTDSGANWTKAHSGLTNTCVTALTTCGDTAFAAAFIGAMHGFLCSTDGGATWVTMSSGPADQVVTDLVVRGSTLFAATDFQGVFLSTDKGVQWSAINEGLTDLSARCLAVHGTKLFVGTRHGGVFRFTDNDTRWLSVNNGLTVSDVRSLATSGTNLYAGTTLGVFFSTDGGESWTASSSGFGSPKIWGLAAIGSTVLAGTHDGVFRSEDNGENWSGAGIEVEDGNVVVGSFAEIGGNIFAGAFAAPKSTESYGGIYRSTDDGRSWVSLSSNGLTHGDCGAPWPGIRDVATTSSNLFAATSGGEGFVYRSDDYGESWSDADSGLTSPVFPLHSIGDTLFAVTWGEGRLIYTSIDNGYSWMVIDSVRTGVPAAKAAGCFVNIGTAQFAGTISGILRSTDDGNQWEIANAGLTDTTIVALAVSGSTVFAATYRGGVFQWMDIGSMWMPVNDGLQTTNVGSLIANDTYLFARTDSGLWRRSLAELVSDVGKGLFVPSCVALEQNFPNPFNPTTTIGYQVPAPGLARLTVFDIVGREVAILVDEKKAPGSYQVKFDASALASGIYIYRLAAGGFVRTRKMIFVK